MNTPDRKTKRECPNAPKAEFVSYKMYLTGEKRREAMIMIYNMCNGHRSFRNFVVESDSEFSLEFKWDMRKVSEWMQEINDYFSLINLGVFINWVPPFNPFTVVLIPGSDDVKSLEQRVSSMLNI